MSNHFDLTHIGEPLIANLLTENKEIIKKIFNVSSNLDNFEVTPNAKIKILWNKISYSVDSRSQIDVAICGKDQDNKNICYALELKLGTSLSSAQMSRFFNNRIAINTQYKNQNLIKGNMLPILRHIPEDFAVRPPSSNIFDVKCVISDECYTLKKYAIMVRTNTIKDRLKADLPLCSVSEIFDEQKTFNDFVTELVQVKDNDYFTAWGLNQPPSKTN